MRRFLLVRKKDATGVSGTGAVAEGVVFSSGRAAMSWIPTPRSIAVYESPEELEQIHGHGGKTKIVWVDE